MHLGDHYGQMILLTFEVLIRNYPPDELQVMFKGSFTITSSHVVGTRSKALLL